MQISPCPTCGSDTVRRVKRDWTGEWEGCTYTVPNLEFYECPACGEKVYDGEAMRSIEAHSPAFATNHTGK